MIQFKFEDSGNYSKLILNGSLDIVHANELKKQLLNAFAKTKKVIVDAELVENIHLSCIQLLHSAYLYAMKNKKEFILLKTWSDKFSKSLFDAGFLNDSNENKHTQAAWLTVKEV